MCRIAYFGTDGCLGHHFKAISGRFSPQEKEDLSKIDEDFQLFGFSGFNFFTYKGYGCLSFSASPDDNRYGSKTVFFVEGTYLKTEVLEALEDIKLSLRQIEKMEHAIGFSREKIKRNRYEAYRNRFVVNNSDKDWEELVSIGYAEKREFEIEKQIVYYVSELGIKYLGVLLGCIIIEGK